MDQPDNVTAVQEKLSEIEERLDVIEALVLPAPELEIEEHLALFRMRLRQMRRPNRPPVPVTA